MTQPTIEFEWSTDKAAHNLKKHGVSFVEATTVFDDEQAYIQADELHSDQEPREIIIGYSERNRLLIVSFVQRADERIRITPALACGASVNARQVTQRERRIYEQKTRF